MHVVVLGAGLLGEAVRVYPAVIPMYVRVGAVWEATEQDYLHRFLKVIARSNLKPLVTFEQPISDLYAKHWSLTGADVQSIALGFVVAFIAGVIVVRYLLDFVSRRGFALFAYWRIFFGAACLWGVLLFK